MPIRFLCPRCEQAMAIGQRKAGTVVDCPGCGRPVTVPTPGEVSPQSDPFNSVDFDDFLLGPGGPLTDDGDEPVPQAPTGRLIAAGPVEKLGPFRSKKRRQRRRSRSRPGTAPLPPEQRSQTRPPRRSKPDTAPEHFAPEDQGAEPPGAPPPVEESGLEDFDPASLWPGPEAPAPPDPAPLVDIPPEEPPPPQPEADFDPFPDVSFPEPPAVEVEQPMAQEPVGQEAPLHEAGEPLPPIEELGAEDLVDFEPPAAPPEPLPPPEPPMQEAPAPPAAEPEAFSPPPWEEPPALPEPPEPSPEPIEATEPAPDPLREDPVSRPGPASARQRSKRVLLLGITAAFVLGTILALVIVPILTPSGTQPDDKPSASPTASGAGVAGTINYRSRPDVAPLPDSETVVIVLPRDTLPAKKIGHLNLSHMYKFGTDNVSAVDQVQRFGGKVARVDKEGRFSIEPLQPGSYWILIISKHLRHALGYELPNDLFDRISSYFDSPKLLLGEPAHRAVMQPLDLGEGKSLQFNHEFRTE